MSYIPDVFVIGAMKAGTSTLWKDIFRTDSLEPSQTKEVNFFLQDHTLDTLEDLYKKQYPQSKAIKIDISPNYSRRHIFAGVAKRIYAANPNAKIVYMVRNPVDRIVSHLHHDMFRDRINASNLRKALFADDSDYIKTSSYFFQIEEYLQFFRKDQILVLALEKMQHQPLDFCRELGDFLGVKDLNPPKRSYNISEKRYLIKYHDAFHRLFPNAILGNLYHYIWYFINVKIPKPSISREDTVALKSILKNDAMKMKEFFGTDISSWL